MRSIACARFGEGQLEAVGGEVLKGEALASLNDKAHERLIAAVKVKARKVKDALEKSRLKEVEK
jgi:hypothetical protein